jgi:hypothetical protein
VYQVLLPNRKVPFNWKVLDDRSLTVKGPRRIFLSFFDPAPVDYQKMLEVSKSPDQLRVCGPHQKANPEQRKAFEKRFRGDPNNSKDSYRVLFGAITCGVHTPERPQKPDSPSAME